MRKDQRSKSEKGQTWVIMAVAITVLIILLGFAIDSAVLFSNYTKLKRAVDAAAVAAANQYKVKNAKHSETDTGFDVTLLKEKMLASANEILVMHDIDTTSVNLTLRICGDSGLQAQFPDFYAKCPEATGGAPRKLVYIQASQDAPTYFMHLVGVNSIPITTNSVSEAAPIDLVLVFDVSESMGINTTGYVPNVFDPAACNTSNTCLPLKTAKDAAKKLINTLYSGYDRVAIVTFDQVGVTRLPLSSVSASDLGPTGAVNAAIDAIPLHDDAPAGKLFSTWYNGSVAGIYNPVNPEDRDNNGDDPDPGLTTCVPSITDKDGNALPLGSWVDWDFHLALGNSFEAATGLKGVPCDKFDKLDAFDWNGDGVIDASDVTASNNWVNEQRHEYCHDNGGGTCSWQVLPMSVLSTCTGCGIRVATANLTTSGRSNAVWVMVVLSDGVANLTDMPQTFPQSGGVGIPTAYPNGYCGGSLGVGNPLWSPHYCTKQDTQRYCINPTPIGALTPVPPGGNCAPTPIAQFVGSFPVSPPYTPDDYARDMVDRAALLHTTNPNEALGSDMAIYSIGLGPAAVNGAPLLRYMAHVGTSGDRDTADPCAPLGLTLPPKQSCGQYYYANTANELGPIFDSIASRIYTKITY